MTIFWVIVALLLVVALLIIAIPLWRGRAHSSAVARDSANLEIFRDQVAEMDSDLRNGLLSQEMYDQGKQELQSRLLDEVQQVNEANAAIAGNPFRILAIIMVVVLPIAAFGLYSKVGNRHAIEQLETAAGGDTHVVHTEAELRVLEAQVDSKPDDAEALYKLARSYVELEHYDQAVMAYEKLTRQYPNESQLWADYADALAMVSGKTLVGKPAEFLDKALQLDPDNYKALALAGSAAMERGDYAATVRHWERLLKMIPAENENAGIIQAGIQKARMMLAQNGGGKPVVAGRESAAISASETITGTVVLSGKLMSQASPDDTVFVLARAAEGPRMPLAIVRKQVRDLPLKFSLDDSMAMSPQMRLSNFNQVVVVARISKSGNAITQPGDLQGSSAVIKPGHKNVKLTIDQVAP